MTSRSTSDSAALALRLRNGDAAAIEQVRGWIRSTLGGYRRLFGPDIEDTEQEILLSLLATLERGEFRHESSMETYVRRMAHYKSIDRVRAHGRRRWVDTEGLDLPEESASALERLEAEQDTNLALRIAAQLPESCRRLWDMLCRGLDYAEMAKRTGVRPGTLRVRVLRCRRQATALRADLLAQSESVKGGGAAAWAGASRKEPADGD